MTRTNLFEIAEQKGHEIVFCELSESEAIAAEIERKCYIGLNPDLPEVDEVELLAHELGHCEYAGFYSILTPLNTKERVERRAEKWAISKLIPLGELRSAILNGVTAPWELADYFHVSESFLFGACEYYTNACGSIMGDIAI